MGWRHEIYGDSDQAARRRSGRWSSLPGALSRQMILKSVGHPIRDELSDFIDLSAMGAALTDGIIDYKQRAAERGEAEKVSTLHLVPGQTEPVHDQLGEVEVDAEQIPA